MAHRRPHQHERHAGDADRAADVEEQPPASQQSDLGPIEQRDVSDTQKQAQLRGAETPEGEMEGTDGVSRKIDFDGKHEVGDEQSESDVQAHISAEPDAANQEERPDGIGNVIDVESIARAQAVAHAGQGTIETVAEPVDGQRQDHPDEGAAVPSGGPIAEARYEHGDETDRKSTRLNSSHLGISY